MDPLTQGALGAALPQATRRRRHVVTAAAFGFLAGLLPDADVLIRSAEDPLLFLEYHRQFTHSLVFVPIGGAALGVLLYAVLGRLLKLSIWQAILFCTLGFATHGLLDAATSYGTQLFWPFTDTRIAWRVISVVDPLFSVPLIFLVGLGLIKRTPKYARVGLAWAAVYLVLGTVQHNRALDAAWSLAESRGHTVTRIEVKPTFGNTVVWRSVYVSGGEFYIDGIRAGYDLTIIPGSSVPVFGEPYGLPGLDDRSQQAEDIRRFAHFSDDYIAQSPDDPFQLIDVRYAFLPNQLDALWSIVIDPSADAATHVRYETHRENARDKLNDLVDMVLGRVPMSHIE